MNPETFWSKVQKSDGCWTWAGGTNGNGRGRVRFEGRMQYAYRVAWELTHGESIPSDMLACHSCDNPICVNPSHIFVGTIADNVHDAEVKGLLTGARNPRKALAHHNATVSGERIAEAVALYLSTDLKQSEVAELYGVTQTTVSDWLHAKVRPDSGLTSTRKPFKPCGTHAAYVRHIRNGEKACEACLAAERAHCAERRAKRVGVAA